MARTPQQLRQEAMDLFYDHIPAEFPLQLEYFHAFQCPVAIAEATVREKILEDFDVLQLLVLRLYEAGFRDPATLSSLSGMRQEMMEKALETEIKIAGHIDPETGELTDTGRESLKANEDGTYQSHMLFHTARRIQIEAATGTVIPAYLEEKDEYMSHLLRQNRDGIVPQESVKQDGELLREINERLEEYRKKDIISEKAEILGLDDLRSTQILYRWAYLAKFQGMQYPMIVMRGRRLISKVNKEAVLRGNFGDHVAVPLAVSRTDSQFLQDQGMDLAQILVREDHFFQYLLEKIEDMDLTQEQAVEDTDPAQDEKLEVAADTDVGQDEETEAAVDRDVSPDEKTETAGDADG